MKKSTWREYADTFAIAVCLALFTRTFIVQAFKIPSGSMIPTLQIGDHILVNKFIYGTRIPFTHKSFFPLRLPERGDIIVFEFPGDESKDFIKRVVGIPGDTVEARNRVLYVNNQKQDEPFVNPMRDIHDVEERDSFGPTLVPEGAYFVMGDNRDHSLDSRFWGFVDFERIKGSAFLIYWSWDSETFWIRLNRMFTLLK